MTTLRQAPASATPSATTTGFAVLDLETTGLAPSRGARIIEIGVVAVGLDGTVVEQWETLVDPGCGPGPTHIHGVDAAMLSGAPSFDEIVGDLARVLAGRTLVAHNATFDVGFLDAELDRSGFAGHAPRCARCGSPDVVVTLPANLAAVPRGVWHRQPRRAPCPRRRAGDGRVAGSPRPLRRRGPGWGFAPRRAPCTKRTGALPARRLNRRTARTTVNPTHPPSPDPVADPPSTERASTLLPEAADGRAPLDELLTRRSIKSLAEPGPTDQQLDTILLAR